MLPPKLIGSGQRFGPLPGTKKHAIALQAEAAYAKQVLADTDQLQEDLYHELRGRIQEADQTVPLRCLFPISLACSPASIPPSPCTVLSCRMHTLCVVLLAFTPCMCLEAAALPCKVLTGAVTHRSCPVCAAQASAFDRQLWLLHREEGYYYYHQTLEGLQYSVHKRRRVPADAGPPTGVLPQAVLPLA